MGSQEKDRDGNKITGTSQSDHLGVGANQQDFGLVNKLAMVHQCVAASPKHAGTVFHFLVASVLLTSHGSSLNSATSANASL